ncbi:Eukaryotic translation initiation factor 4 gamma 1 [Stylosanthes scabra]|uniref:Eukaryotic translation initiation factor 4 gamma 1 n=1 Tax=Stylosanthes scabra TaxID=79078 RepID=A0ABU6TP68_9FABA|nr:Eukaryotic translation initiation factor 4 gamma 1 [Stylosanthes scabra]
MKHSSPVNEVAVSVVSNNEEKGKESLSRSNSLKDTSKVQKEGQLQHLVAVQSPTVANVPSQDVKRSTGGSETVASKTNYSAAVTSEVVTATTEDTISTPSLSVPHSEAKSNGAAELSGSVSADGPAAQAVDSLKANDEPDEFSQLDKLSKNKDSEMGEKTEISSIQGCKQEVDESTGCPPEYVNQSSTALGSSTDVCLSRDDIAVGSEAVSASSGTLDQSSDILETTTECCGDGSENAGSVVSLPAPDTNDTPILDQNKVKTTSKGKKKRKEILQKADAAGSTSDLYNAYKGPEEKKDAVVSAEKEESVSTSGSLELSSTGAAQPDCITSELCGQSKAELDDWEDAADMSTPKLEFSGQTEQVTDSCTVTVKRYSRDFLLKFAEQCTNLPEGFEITADIAESLMGANINSSRDPHPSPGRIIDRPSGMSRMDRRGGAITEEDKWSKVSNSFHSGMRLDGIGGNAGFHPIQGGNFGVLRNPRSPLPYAGAGGILSGPMQSMGNLGGMPRNSSDSERWQRASSFQQRGLIPSPQSPLQMMHKADKKYEVGKVTDAEEAKQRQLKAILNKLTPQNFEKLFEQVKTVNIDNAVTLTGVISQIFEKALMEPTFCEMYANFCSHLAAELPDFSEDNEKITFKRLLLNKCQEEFERGEREQEEANKADEGEVKQSAEEREEKRTKARRRMLGNIRLIGELYKKRMLTERIMHECIRKLLGQHQDPDEEDIEALCKLMSTIGEMIDHPKAKEHIDDEIIIKQHEFIFKGEVHVERCH